MFWQDKRVLITGINGFLGRNLAEGLTRQGAQIYGFGRSTSKQGDRDHSDNSTQFFLGNIDVEESVRNGISSSEPDIIFHLAAQSSVADSFQDPSKTCLTNCLGTSNLLEAVCRLKDDPVIVFAGSSDEYGLVFSTKDQYNQYVQEHGEPDYPPSNIPEIPISENNPLRPLSPYAVSKVYGDLLMKNYHQTHGVKTVVCRSFNVEGAGRGDQYVTSVIAKQVAGLQSGHINKVIIGNINPIRDFSHVQDIVSGYQILAERGRTGNAYNLGSMRGVSIATYLLTCLEIAGHQIDKIETQHGDITLSMPLSEVSSSIFGTPLPMSNLDKSIIEGNISFSQSNRGIIVYSRDTQIEIHFDPNKFRPVDIPILIADARKVSKIGYQPVCSLRNIIQDQLTYYRQAPPHAPLSTTDTSP
ncbi:MAG TPA: GDP-mannose 4,6-dehydratase [Methanospirillum sp.]|nr:GDP-mannose 4,6-dehydratase [Methanospirillum sp.]